MDTFGVASSSPIGASWTSTGGEWSSTGRGEENNSATNENGDLMAGYLDTNGGPPGVSITLTNLSAGPHDVYVYIQGGVNGRGGDYNLTSNTGYNTTYSHTTDTIFSGSFLGQTTTTNLTNSNYLLFTGVTGSSLTLTTTVTATRAPVNAIEVTGVPEPSSVVGCGIAGLGVLVWRRKR